MKELLRHSAVPSIFVLLLVFGCAFPSDPPQKVTPITPPTTADTTLLPLRIGVGWVYDAVQRSGYKKSFPALVDSIIIAGESYYQVVYGYSDPSGYKFIHPIPYLMQNGPGGLSLFAPAGPDDMQKDSPPPQLQYVFPYPASVGASWKDTSISGPTSGYRVILAAKDTTILDARGVKRLVYRYNVYDQMQNVTVFYVLPGVAFIRIEARDVTFYTTTWLGLQG